VLELTQFFLRSLSVFFSRMVFSLIMFDFCRGNRLNKAMRFSQVYARVRLVVRSGGKIEKRGWQGDRAHAFKLYFIHTNSLSLIN
jgi:hypothetical protein